MRQNLRVYRDELKGLAILWIVFFHARLGLPQGLLYQFQQHGYGGVDCFLFLSGFGLYHSLARLPEAGAYWRRRLWRLLPAYLPICLLWLVCMPPSFGLSTVPMLQTVFGNLLMVGFWAQAPLLINWYPAVLLLTITLAPIFFGLLSTSGHPARTFGGLFALCLASGLCFLGDERLMAVSRLPVFLLGMGFAMAPEIKLRPRLKITVYFLAALTGLGMLWLCESRFPLLLTDAGMYWYPFLLLTPVLCAALSWCFQATRRIQRLFSPLRYLGKASFEIFLFNAWAELYLKKGIQSQNPGHYLLGAVLSVALGCAYHAALETGKRALERKRHALQN